MAKIKTVSNYQKQGAAQLLIPPDMETVEEHLESHSIRMPKEWWRIMKDQAVKLTILRGKKIRTSDVLREAAFQYCIKKVLKDNRETVLRASKSVEDAKNV